MNVRGCDGRGVRSEVSRRGGRGVMFRNRGGVSPTSASPGSFVGFSAVLGGVRSSPSRRSGVRGRAPYSDGADDIVPEYVLLSPLTLSRSSPFAAAFFRRLTILCFFLRPWAGFPCLDGPIVNPDAADPMLESVGLVDEWWAESVVSPKT